MRQIYMTFQGDPVAMELIPFFGEGQAIERQMSHPPPELRRKLTHDNAAALLGQ